MKASEAAQETGFTVRTLRYTKGVVQEIWGNGRYHTLLNGVLTSSTGFSEFPRQGDWQVCPAELAANAESQMNAPAMAKGRLADILKPGVKAQIRYLVGEEVQIAYWDGESFPDNFVADCAILFDEQWEVL